MFIIYGKCRRQQAEEIDTAESKKDAEYLISEYRLAFGPDWHIWSRPAKERKANND